mgnify:CR=1 FL=1
MSGFASNDDSSSPSNKRTRFFNNEGANVPQVAGSAKKQLVTKSPTEAAMALKNSHIATLHLALQPFLHDLTETCLRRYAAYYYKNAKHEEMYLDPNYVPASCKKIGLTMPTLLHTPKGGPRSKPGLCSGPSNVQRPLAALMPKKLSAWLTITRTPNPPPYA